jgi:poly(A) polymerase
MPNAIRRLAALLPPDPAVGDSVAARLKLSKADRTRLVTAMSPRTEDLRDEYRLAYRIGWVSAVDQLLLNGRAVAAVQLNAATAAIVPRFPLTGGAIVSRGVKAGPDVARLMHRIEDQWVAEGFPDAARVEAIADAVVAEALGA